MRRMPLTLVLSASIVLGACNGPTTEAVEQNAIVAESDTRDAADRRAENLDRLADGLDAEAGQGGNAAAALRNEAAADRAEADDVRTSGDAAAAAIESNTEDSVGLNRR